MGVGQLAEQKDVDRLTAELGWAAQRRLATVFQESGDERKFRTLARVTRNVRYGEWSTDLTVALTGLIQDKIPELSVGDIPDGFSKHCKITPEELATTIFWFREDTRNLIGKPGRLYPKLRQLAQKEAGFLGETERQFLRVAIEPMRKGLAQILLDAEEEAKRSLVEGTPESPSTQTCPTQDPNPPSISSESNPTPVTDVSGLGAEAGTATQAPITTPYTTSDNSPSALALSRIFLRSIPRLLGRKVLYPIAVFFSIPFFVLTTSDIFLPSMGYHSYGSTSLAVALSTAAAIAAALSVKAITPKAMVAIPSVLLSLTAVMLVVSLIFHIANWGQADSLTEDARAGNTVVGYQDFKQDRPCPQPSEVDNWEHPQYAPWAEKFHGAFFTQCQIAGGKVHAELKSQDERVAAYPVYSAGTKQAYIEATVHPEGQTPVAACGLALTDNSPLLFHIDQGKAEVLAANKADDASYLWNDPIVSKRAPASIGYELTDSNPEFKLAILAQQKPGAGLRFTFLVNDRVVAKDVQLPHPPASLHPTIFVKAGSGEAGGSSACTFSKFQVYSS
ncbi:hypothetical protein ABZ769_11410 [Streptomyces olivoreticuli]